MHGRPIAICIKNRSGLEDVTCYKLNCQASNKFIMKVIILPIISINL